MLKNVVFDMGNVLIGFDHDVIMDQHSLNEEERKLVREKLFLGENWKLHDLGILDEEQLYQRTVEQLPEHLHKTVHELVFHWHDPVLPIKGMDQLIRQLKQKGMRLYLLSNAGKDQKSYWNRIPGSEFFDAAVVSAFEGCIKPDPKIYKILLERYHLRVEECLFIDDMEENLTSAKKLGMDVIRFDGDVKKLKNEIEKRLGEEKIC